MVHYDDYRKYHEALKNTNFSDFSNIIFQVETSSSSYDNLASNVNSINWQSRTHTVLSSKMSILSDSMQKLQENITVKFHLIIDNGEKLLEILESMKQNQENCDGAIRTVYELNKKRVVEKKKAEEQSPYAADYADVWGVYFSIDKKYESALKNRNDYQTIINGLAVKADTLIKALQSIDYYNDIQEVVSEPVVVEEVKNDSAYEIYITKNIDDLSPIVMKGAIKILIDNLNNDAYLLHTYLQSLDYKLNAIDNNISLLSVGTPEYLEAYSYQSNLIDLRNQTLLTIDERENLSKTVTDISYDGGWFGWNKGELYQAIEKEDKTTIASMIIDINNKSKDLIPINDIATPDFKLQFKDSYAKGDDSKTESYYEDFSKIGNKIQVQEAYVDAAINGRLTNMEGSIQRFSTIDQSNNIYTYDYNTLDNTYSLISITDSQNYVEYKDGSLG